MIRRLLPLLGAAPLVASVAAPCASARTQPQSVEARDDARIELAAAVADYEAAALLGDAPGDQPGRIADLAERARALVAAAPASDARGALLARVWRLELDALGRTGAPAERHARILAHVETALGALRSDAPSDAEFAVARVAARTFEPGAVSALLGAAAPGPAEADALLLRDAVADAIEKKATSFLHDLGPSAAPALEELALAPRTGVDADADPLSLLFAADTERGLRVALELLERDGPLGRLRVVRALRNDAPFGSDGAKRGTADPRRILRSPEYARVTRILAADPTVDRELIDRLLAPFSELGEAPEALLPALAEGLLRRAPRPGTLSAGTRRVAHHAARSSDVELAAAGVRTLLQDGHALLAPDLLGDGRSDVRALVAEGFALPAAPGADPSATGHALVVFAGRADDAAGGRAVEAALTNPALRVSLPTDAPVEAWLGRVSKDPWLRAWAAYAARRPAPARPDAFDRLVDAAQLDPAGDRATVALRTAYRAGDFDAVLDLFLALERRSDRRPRGTGATRALLAVLPELCAEEPEGAGPLVERALERVTPTDLVAFVENPDVNPGRVEARPWLSDLPESTRVRLVRALAGTGYARLERLGGEPFALPPRLWIELAAEDLGTPEVQAWLLSRAPRAEGPRLAPGDADLVVAAMVRAGRPVLGWHEVRDLGLDDESVVRSLIESPAAPDDLVAAFYADLEDESLVDAVLDRLPPARWEGLRSHSLISAVLHRVARRPEAHWNEVLLAANVPGTTLQAYLVGALQGTRVPARLDVAGAILASDRFRDRDVRDQAIALVAESLDPRAAEYLFRAAQVWRDADGRDRLLAAVQELLAWQEATTRSAELAERGARQGAAITELAGVAANAQGSIEERVAAIRGLVALDARAELPLLIELLGAEEPAIAAAAGRALDRLAP